MKTTEKVLLSALVAAFLTLVCWMFISVTRKEPAPSPVIGNIASSDAMTSTTTGPFTGVGDAKLLCTGPAILGSINITGPVLNSQFYILDATTTDILTGNAARKATSTLIVAEVSKTVQGTATSTGSIPYNAYAKNGLIIGAFGNSLATTTITYRCLSN
jgi:hypothetical protein